MPSMDLREKTGRPRSQALQTAPQEASYKTVGKAGSISAFPWKTQVLFLLNSQGCVLTATPVVQEVHPLLASYQARNAI